MAAHLTDEGNVMVPNSPVMTGKDAIGAAMKANAEEGRPRGPMRQPFACGAGRRKSSGAFSGILIYEFVQRSKTADRGVEIVAR